MIEARKITDDSMLLFLSQYTKLLLHDLLIECKDRDEIIEKVKKDPWLSLLDANLDLFIREMDDEDF